MCSTPNRPASSIHSVGGDTKNAESEQPNATLIPLDKITGLCANKLIAVVSGTSIGEMRVVKITKSEYRKLAAWLRAQPSKLQQAENLPLPESKLTT